MAELKTKATKVSVASFLKTVPDESMRADAKAVVGMMREITKEEPVMWGASIIGFGKYSYEYESGQKGDWPIIGLSPRKQNLTLYIMPGFDEQGALMKKLGPHKTGKSCLYLKRLSDVDLPTLKTLMKKSVAMMRKKYPSKRAAA
jgi:hypothetical protein